MNSYIIERIIITKNPNTGDKKATTRGAQLMMAPVTKGEAPFFLAWTHTHTDKHTHMHAHTYTCNKMLVYADLMGAASYGL